MKTEKGVDSRPLFQVGRHARLELVFDRRGDRTVLTHGYAEPPLRIGRTFDVDGAAYVILVCAGPGVFAGDCLHQRVTVGPGARVLVASQSALQVHPAGAPAPATVHSEYQVAEGGELHCQWDPVIPFAGARLVQRIDLRVARNSRFYWSDALMSGRASRGEAWRFESIDHELRLAIDGSLKYLERYRVIPAERGPRRVWAAGRADYLGTAILHHDRADTSIAEQLQREVNEVLCPGGPGSAGSHIGVDLVADRLIVGRLLAECGAGFARARAAFRARAAADVFLTPQLVFRSRSA